MNKEIYSDEDSFDAVLKLFETWEGMVEINETDEARKAIVEAMGQDRTFDRYIKKTLAGDFAVKIAGVLNRQGGDNGEGTKGAQIGRESARKCPGCGLSWSGNPEYCYQCAKERGR